MNTGEKQAGSQLFPQHADIVYGIARNIKRLASTRLYCFFMKLLACIYQYMGVSYKLELPGVKIAYCYYYYYYYGIIIVVIIISSSITVLVLLLITERSSTQELNHH